MCCDYLPTTSPHYPCSFHSTHPQILFPFCFPCILLPTATLYYLILPSLNLFQELFLDLYQHVCIYFLFLFFFLMNSSRFHWHNFSPKVLRSSGYWTPLPKSWNYVIFMLIKKKHWNALKFAWHISGEPTAVLPKSSYAKCSQFSFHQNQHSVE